MTGVYLSALALSHFRSHKRCELDLDGRPVAIYGPNGAGKTNILEAVSLLSPGRGLRRASAEEMARRPESVGWRVSGVLQRRGAEHEIDTRSEGGAARVVRVDGKVAPQNALGRLVRVVWLVPVMDRLWVEGAEGRRRFLDRMTLSFVPDHGDAVLTYEKAMRERNRLLKDQVRDPAWYGALETQMAKAGAEIGANRRLAIRRVVGAQMQAETAFPVAELGLIGSDGDAAPEAEADLVTALADGRARDLVAGRTLVGPHRDDLSATYLAKGMPARECSTGEQKALLISLILANGRAVAADGEGAPLLLLDEVAAHLDGDRRAALYDEICALGAQAFMSGTGPELFTELGTRAQAFELDRDGAVHEGSIG